MNYHIIFVFFLLLQLSLASFDFFILVETWPPSFCKNKQCVGVPKKRFSLHGLWPQNNSSPQPSQCNTNYKFDTNKIPSNLERKLKTSWPSLTGNNEGFWRHEWIDHGTCSMLQPIHYFNLAVNLHTNNLINIILQNNNIKPGGAKPILKTDIVNAIKAHIDGKEPQLVCDTSGNLVEVRICFDKSSSPNYEDCPKPNTKICGNDVYYP